MASSRFQPWQYINNMNVANGLVTPIMPHITLVSVVDEHDSALGFVDRSRYPQTIQDRVHGHGRDDLACNGPNRLGPGGGQTLERRLGCREEGRW